MVKTYKDFFKHLDYNRAAQQLVENFLKEPIAFKVKAEPGWRLIALGPTDDRYDVEVDFIPVDEWAVFTSFHFVDLEGPEVMKRSLINTQSEQTVPVIPKRYNGKLKHFFYSIEEDIPEWNRVTIPSLMIGCIGPNDTRSEEELVQRAKEIWSSSRKRIEEEEKAIKQLSESMNVKLPKSGDDLETILGNLINPGKIDKTKLN